ncbi:MAG: hypothetical protein EZS28_020368 [Streblomastix strix]|uniref:Uncharacterized protein n=1 Tax=Streblomastix strix TaxID=222440 RepID=A0A5J4VNN2_9EUKA|nr:MAG: hypothetical protein EZS28_020368 [Streblomastix strix]
MSVNFDDIEEEDMNDFDAAPQNIINKISPISPSFSNSEINKQSPSICNNNNSTHMLLHSRVSLQQRTGSVTTPNVLDTPPFGKISENYEKEIQELKIRLQVMENEKQSLTRELEQTKNNQSFGSQHTSTQEFDQTSKINDLIYKLEQANREIKQLSDERDAANQNLVKLKIKNQMSIREWDQEREKFNLEKEQRKQQEEKALEEAELAKLAKNQAELQSEHQQQARMRAETALNEEQKMRRIIEKERDKEKQQRFKKENEIQSLQQEKDKIEQIAAKEADMKEKERNLKERVEKELDEEIQAKQYECKEKEKEKQLKEAVIQKLHQTVNERDCERELKEKLQSELNNEKEINKQHCENINQLVSEVEQERNGREQE